MKQRWALIAGGLVLALVGALNLRAPALDPPSRAALPPVVPSPKEPPPPATSCLAGSGVAIGVSDDAQSVVNEHGAGTIYIVKAGIHLRNFSVQPKPGDRFCGEPGAVLDGGRSLASAFSGGPRT
jgi:hypothetical protein